MISFLPVNLKKISREITVIPDSMEDSAAAVPYSPLRTSEYMAIVKVLVGTVYKSMDVASSVSMPSQLNIAPDTTPDNIQGRVMTKKVLRLDAPRLMPASSVLMLI